ncbi:uncharacterized protein LOC123011816 [Tribolium madens]|uniref:uncharacterized protein LOC123011816 n=1 Tax=Tribolium madens TaxID=41895 RepID=UPI001CF724CF|nr:uncharacterized protein LOC123011816 [Tribolium madens]
MNCFVCITFTFVIIIGAQGLTEQQTEKLNQVSKECRTLTGVSQETITNARNGNFEDDPKLKLQILCVGKKVGIMTKSGQVDENVLKSKLRKVSDNDEEVDKIYHKCAIKKQAPEETAFETIKCVMKNKPKFSATILVWSGSEVGVHSSKMKFLVCLLFVIVAVNALTQDQKEKLDKISKECKNQSGVSQELIDKARTGELTNDPKLKAQIYCVSKKTGLATEAGEINMDNLKTKLKKVAANDDEVNKIIQKCVVKKPTPEETAFEVYKCLHANKPNFSVVD